MNGLVNAARGEVELIIDGRPCRLCLTLGGLAQLESALGADGPGDVAGKLGALRARDLLLVLEALLAGGGDPMDAAALGRAVIDPLAAAEAVSEAFRSALGGT